MKQKITLPQGIALWLKQNTKLTHEQIMTFCDLDTFTFYALETNHVQPCNPCHIGHLDQVEIARCEANSKLVLKDLFSSKDIVTKSTYKYVSKTQRAKYAGVIHWLVNHNPQLDLKMLASILSTNVSYVQRVINQEGVIATDPIKSGVLTHKDMEKLGME